MKHAQRQVKALDFVVTIQLSAEAFQTLLETSALVTRSAVTEFMVSYTLNLNSTPKPSTLNGKP